MREKIRLVLMASLLVLAGCVTPPDKPSPLLSRSAEPAKLPEAQSSELRPSAEAGDRRAQYALGQLLLDKGSYFDPSPEGIAWLEKASAQGSVEARLALGYRYRAAYCGGPADRSEKCPLARRWFSEAAETGDVEAMGALVSMLSRPPLADPSQAYYWSLLRQRQKAMPPSSWVEESTALKAALPPDQATQTERKVALWRPAP